MTDITDDQLEEIKDNAWSRGNDSAYSRILLMCCRELGCDNPAVEHTKWIAERQEILSCLREVCGDFGDNDWPDNLYIPDIINKHLANYLHDNESVIKRRLT